MTSIIPLNYICFINETGYGQAAFDMISSLEETGLYDIRITCLNGSLSKNFLSTDSYKKLERLVKKPPNSKEIQIYHCIPSMQSRVLRGNHSIGFATFETYEPPKHWVDILNRMDAVICPSEFNFSIFAHAGVKRPIFHIPHCFDPLVWNENVQPLTKYEKYSFLFIGSWRRRKGWAQLLEAYFREFNFEEQVQLIIKTDKVQLAIQDVEKIKRSVNIKKEYPSIVFERTVFNDKTLPSFYKSADCLILPTFGEGFGLPAMQCMTIKVPVIVTNFSGCQEYASNDRCTLLEPSGFMIHEGMDQIMQFANKKWPRIMIESIQSAMRHVFSNQELSKLKADKAYEYVHDKFSYKTVSKSYSKMMESVYGVH